MLAIALAKISLPGCMNLSPVCKPEMDNTMAVSRCLIPRIETSAMVYSRGILAFSHSSNFGSTEVGLVVSSCDLAVSTEAIININRTWNRSESRCMGFFSNQNEARHACGETNSELVGRLYFIKAAKLLLRRQINGKYRKCLLKRTGF